MLDPLGAQALQGIPVSRVLVELRGLRLSQDSTDFQDQHLVDWARLDLREREFPLVEPGSQRIDLCIVRAMEITPAAPVIGIGIETTEATTAGGVRGVVRTAMDIGDCIRACIRDGRGTPILM